MSDQLLLMNERAKWYAGLGVAVINDVNDIVGFGALPIVGDVLDVATSTALWPLLDNRERALTFIEFIPGADYLPTYTATLLWSWNKNGPKMPSPSEKKMREIAIE